MSPLAERLPGLTGGLNARADSLRRSSEKHLARRDWIAAEQALAGADAYAHAVGEIEAWAKLHGDAETSVVAGLAPCSHPRPGESAQTAEAINRALRQVREFVATSPDRWPDTFLGTAQRIQVELCEAARVALAISDAPPEARVREALIRLAACAVEACARRWTPK